MRSKILLTVCLLSTVLLCSCNQKTQTEKEEPPVDSFAADFDVVENYLAAFDGDFTSAIKAFTRMDHEWKASYAPMLIEGLTLMNERWTGERMIKVLETNTEQNFGPNFDKWFAWLWEQPYAEHEDYVKFKKKLYSIVDPSFVKYFDKTDDAKIRLDEIRWGGVSRDGIPPLVKPKMLSISKATYLEDDNVVFGIYLNGEARCYPKRILAWHEMFKDTIGGVSVCGVY